MSFISFFCVRAFSDALGFFKVIRQWSFDASLTFLVYRRSAEINLKDVRFVGWPYYKDKTGYVLGIPERRVPNKKRYSEGLLVVESLSQVDATIILQREWRCMTLNKQSDWHWRNTKTMTTIAVVLLVIKSTRNLLSRWQGIFIAYKISVVEVGLCYKHFGIFVQTIMIRNRLTWLRIRPVLKIESLPALEMSSSRISSLRQADVFGLIRRNMRQRLPRLTDLPSQLVLLPENTLETFGTCFGCFRFFTNVINNNVGGRSWSFREARLVSCEVQSSTTDCRS